MGMWFTPSNSVSLVSVIPPVLHTHLSLTSGTNGRNRGTFQQSVLFGNREHLIENCLHIFRLRRLICVYITNYLHFFTMFLSFLTP